ncbi:hypothetical protein DL767_004145 [Monosporascus sp. MG133]|nr:hypothetical protein DL767_004145 [Monosporascus sp. MG133]
MHFSQLVTLAISTADIARDSDTLLSKPARTSGIPHGATRRWQGWKTPATARSPAATTAIASTRGRATTSAAASTLCSPSAGRPTTTATPPSTSAKPISAKRSGAVTAADSVATVNGASGKL